MAHSPRALLRRRSLVLLATAALAVVGAGCGGDDEGSPAAGGGSAEPETQQVTFLLPAPLGINWTTFLVARERYWPEAGLDVEGVGTDGSSAVVQQIVSGNAEYGIASAAVVYTAAEEGADVKGIATLTHDDVARLSVPESDSATTPADLKDKSIGITSAGDGSIPIVQAVMREAGLQKTDYKLPIVGEGGPAVAQAFKDGRIQAYAHGLSDVAGLTIAGKTPLRSIMPEDYNGLPGNVLTVSQKSLDDPAKRETAIKLGQGWIEAAQFVNENPDEAQAIACEAVPQGCVDEATAKLQVKLSGDTTKPLDPERPGYNDPEKIETLLTAVAGEPTIPIDEVLPNDYVDELSRS